MKLLKSLLFTSFLTVLMIAGVHAQANSLKQISFVIDRYEFSPTGSFRTSARLLGDNIDVTATVWQQTAPYYCLTLCEANSTLRLWGPDDNAGLKNASGTIDGIFYPNLYIFHTFQYTNPETKIPKQWSKTVRISAPITLTGNIGIWRTEQEVGDPSRALYLHNGINFPGQVKLILRTVLASDRRYFRDKYISFDFSAVN
jgi:hypothetical protein